MADETDFHILARVWHDPFASYEAIGHELGLSGNTAKKRLERLEADGVISGIWALPAPQLFHRHARIFAFREPRRPAQALEAALRTDPVAWALERTDHRVSVLAYLESPTDGAPEKLVRLLGSPIFTVSPAVFQRPGDLRVLSPLDLRVLRVLVRQPRASLQELATLSGLSPKTVRRRRDEMFRDEVFSILTPLQGARSHGLVVYNLLVQTPEVTLAQRGAILAALPRCVLLSETENPKGLYLLGRAPSLAQALQDEERARGAPGVTHVQLNLFLRHEFAAERIEGWIQEQIQMWDRARRKKPAKD